MSARLWEQHLPILKIKKRVQSALKSLWLFFQKDPNAAALRPNRKGQGFHLFTPAPAKAGQYRVLAMAACCLAGAGIALAAMRAAPGFAVPVGAMLALCGLLAYDVVSRRVWETQLVRRIDELCDKHDRVVRETARNRSDIAVLKEGLGDMAQSVAAQGSRLPPSSTAEAQLIGTIVTKLGALGEAPRAPLDTAHDSAILRLEMAPPPSGPAPRSELDSALTPDFGKYSDAVVAELVHSAVRNDKVDLFLQPVVGLPQRRARMHEVYARIRAEAGTYIPAERYLEMAQKERLLPTIDNLLLLRCLKMLRDRGGENGMPYIINISGATLGDKGFMNDLVAFLARNHKMAHRLIFELPQRDLAEHGAAIGPVIEGLSKLGCRFSMDRVRNRTIDINYLKSANIRFIKLDAGWLIKESRSPQGFSRIVRLKKQLDAAGIDLVVERIESEAALRELLDFGIDYGQGYLFGKPDHHAAYREAKAA